MFIIPTIVAWIIAPVASFLLVLEVLVFFILYSRKKIQNKVPAWVASMGYWFAAGLTLIASTGAFFAPQGEVAQQICFVAACTLLLVALALGVYDIRKIWLLDEPLRERNRFIMSNSVKK